MLPIKISERMRNGITVSQMNRYFIFTKRLFLLRYVCPCFLLAGENSLELEEAKRFNRELQVRGIVLVVLVVLLHVALYLLSLFMSTVHIN